MVVIRLTRGGAKKRPFYHIVATDKQSRRDGRFIERIGYYNPVAIAGEAKTIERSARAGVDGLLVVDLPPEEAVGLRGLARAASIPLIPLVAPTTDDERVRTLLSPNTSAEADGARGFVYYVSMTGVTGANASDLAAAQARAASLRSTWSLPVLVGFGIDGPVAAREAVGPRGAGADGVVVGTALVKCVEGGRSRP